MERYRWSGFTLAELLIALGILGIIATFTIPKVLSSQQNGKYKVIAKEAAGTISGAFSEYCRKQTFSGATSAADLVQYINYVKRDSSSLLDGAYGNGSVDCAFNTCLQLHNGSTLLVPVISFAGTASTNAVYFYLDPDSTYSGSPTGDGKSVVLFLYANGRITTYGNMLPGTVNSFGPEAACSTCDPPWFGWN